MSLCHPQVDSSEVMPPWPHIGKICPAGYLEPDTPHAIGLINLYKAYSFVRVFVLAEQSEPSEGARWLMPACLDNEKISPKVYLPPIHF